MSEKRLFLYLIVLCVVFISCENKHPMENDNCVISGLVTTNNQNSIPNGIKITLQNISDKSVKYIAVTGDDGTFMFRNVEAGNYYLTAEKEGFKWIWMVDDGIINHNDQNVILRANDVKNIEIYMSTSWDYSLEFKLSLTDMGGNPIDNSVHVQKFATTLSFKLYNGTDKNQSWSIDNINNCFVSDDIGVHRENVFCNFTPQSGTLKSGDNVVLVGVINQNIWNVYKNYPYYVYGELFFLNSLKQKNITLDIDF